VFIFNHFPCKVLRIIAGGALGGGAVNLVFVSLKYVVPINRCTHDCCCCYCYCSKSTAANWPVAIAAWRTGWSWGRPAWDRVRSTTNRMCRRSCRWCPPIDLQKKQKKNRKTHEFRTITVVFHVSLYVNEKNSLLTKKNYRICVDCDEV